jgi:hypothetical protein
LNLERRLPEDSVLAFSGIGDDLDLELRIGPAAGFVDERPPAPATAGEEAFAGLGRIPLRSG